MEKEELIIAIKQRMTLIYLITEESVADDLFKIFDETLNYLENN